MPSRKKVCIICGEFTFGQIVVTGYKGQRRIGVHVECLGAVEVMFFLGNNPVQRYREDRSSARNE